MSGRACNFDGLIGAHVVSERVTGTVAGWIQSPQKPLEVMILVAADADGAFCWEYIDDVKIVPRVDMWTKKGGQP